MGVAASALDRAARLAWLFRARETALVAGIVAALSLGIPSIGMITAAAMLLFIWHRPVLLRLWTVAVKHCEIGCRQVMHSRIR